MPDIHFECPKCTQSIETPEELASQLIECPTCKERIKVPTCSQRKEPPKPPEAAPKSALATQWAEDMAAEVDALKEANAPKPAPAPAAAPRKELATILEEYYATPKPALAPAAAPSLPGIEKSGVAVALSIIAVLEVIAAPIAGFAVGQDNTSVGWMIFLGGLTTALILLGFASVIEDLDESAQRLYRIEILIQKASEEKTPPNKSPQAPAAAPLCSGPESLNSATRQNAL